MRLGVVWFPDVEVVDSGRNLDVCTFSFLHSSVASGHIALLGTGQRLGVTGLLDGGIARESVTIVVFEAEVNDFQ